MKFKAAILDYPLPVWLYSVRASSAGMLDPQYMDVVVEISLLS